MDASRPRADQDLGEETPRVSASSRLMMDDPARATRWAAWQAENAEAIAGFNRWYEENGHPLAAHMKPLDGAV